MYVYIYSTTKIILPFATAWIDLEGIMLSEINHTETYVWNLEKAKFLETERGMVVARDWGLVEMGEILVKVYKI